MRNDLCLSCDGRGFVGELPSYPGQRWRKIICSDCRGIGKRRPAPILSRVLVGILLIVAIGLVIHNI